MANDRPPYLKGYAPEYSLVDSIVERRVRTPGIVSPNENGLVPEEETERVLKNPISYNTRREVENLWREAIVHEREKTKRELSKPTTVTMPVKKLTGLGIGLGLVCGVFGFWLGSMGSEENIPAVRPPDAMINIVSGEVIQMTEAEKERRALSENIEASYRPAFYCWKCKAWHPTADPSGEGKARKRPPRPH